LYNFGSPKVGNGSFVQSFNKLVPDSFRVVVDGDMVTGVPPGYSHVGTEILIDDTGAGSIIVDPSFVERWLRKKFKTSVAAHSLLMYINGLTGVIESAQFMDQYADCVSEDINADSIKLAMRTRALLTEEKKKRAGSLRPASSDYNTSPLIPSIRAHQAVSDGVSPSTVMVDQASSSEEVALNEARHYAVEYEKNADWLECMQTAKSEVTTKEDGGVANIMNSLKSFTFPRSSQHEGRAKLSPVSHTVPNSSRQGEDCRASTQTGTCSDKLLDPSFSINNDDPFIPKDPC
jgi:hypothetical protein